MKWKLSNTSADNARALLPKLVEEYFEAGRQAADGKRSAKELHRFRMATKRFRYSLELFRPVYGPSLDRQLDGLRKLQNVLGKLSDCHTVKTLVAHDQSLAIKIERDANKRLTEFHKQWAAFDSDGQLQRWKSYLARGRARA